MTNKCDYLMRVAAVGVVLIASGCSLGNDEPVIGEAKGVETAFGNAGFDRDGDFPGAGNGAVAGGGGGMLAGAAEIPGENGPDGNPGNSAFGRGAHADAGGGNGSETGDGEALSDNNPDLDPGKSGTSNGRSMNND